MWKLHKSFQKSRFLQIFLKLICFLLSFASLIWTKNFFSTQMVKHKQNSRNCAVYGSSKKDLLNTEFMMQISWLMFKHVCFIIFALIRFRKIVHFTFVFLQRFRLECKFSSSNFLTVTFKWWQFFPLPLGVVHYWRQKNDLLWEFSDEKLKS